MEVATDIDLPSPKRLRVEAPNLSNTIDPPDYLDDFSDIYGPPSKEEDSRNEDMSPSISGETEALSNAIPGLPSLPGLPGLDSFNDDAVPASSIAKSQTEDINQSGLKRAIKFNMTDDETGRSGPAEIPSTNVNGLDFSAIRSMQSSSINDAKDTSLQKSSGELMPEVDEVSSSGALPLPRRVEDTLEDPLAFLEASLSPELSRKSGEQDTNGMVVKEETKILVEAPTFEQLAIANKRNVDAEFELDSSPLNSDPDSLDDMSSSDEGDDDDYKMLDPEEHARRLMAEDGGSDDDGAAAKEKASGPLRTQNEKPDEDVPKPDVLVTVDMKIEELGNVEGIVENVVLIKAKISGEYQVLEQGSLLCLEDRSVIGVVAETLGRVQQPYYSVRFTNVAAIAEAGIAKDSKIFYVEQFSTSVFTQPLRAFKGSDASNLHDEEVGDDELEFSDDEAEAEHKRRVKMQRHQKRTGREGQQDGFSKGSRGRRGVSGRGRRIRGGNSHNDISVEHRIQGQTPSTTEAALDYDDIANEMNVDREDLYTPLARPTNLHQMMETQPGISENPSFQRGRNEATHNRGRNRGDHRGGHGVGHGRGQGRGGFGNKGGHNTQQRPSTFLPSPLQQKNGITQPSAQQFPSIIYPAAAPTQQQPFSPFLQGQYPPPQWNQQPAPQTTPQQYNTNTYPTQQQYLPYTQPSQTSHLTGNVSNSIPAGAHINPAFFRQPQHQQQQQPQLWPQQE